TEDTSSPYSVSWNTTTASEGSHVLQAIARDDNGNLGFSSNITVIVDNVVDYSPTVSITGPANNATLSEMVTVTATASDANGDLIGVQFKVNGENLGDEDTSFPYSACWNTQSVSNGSYTLTAVARDAAGNSTTSTSINVTVDNIAPPCVSIPTTNQWFDTPIIEQTGNFSIDFDVTVSEEKACDIALSQGNCTSENDAAAIIRFKDGDIITKNGQAWSNSQVPYIVNETYHVTIVIDLVNDTYDAFVSELGSTPIQVANDHNSRAKPSSLDNLAGRYDTSTSGSQADICNIVIDGEAPASNPPTVALTSPTNGATVSGTISVTATASDVDSDLTGVQFKLNGSNLGSQDTTSPYSYSWNTTGVSNGVYTITAVATDGAGNSTTSAARTITVSNASGGSSPTVSITAPSNNATVSNTVTITANASDADSDLVGVQFKLDGSNLGSQDTSAPYAFSWDTNGASNGSHTITAVATDAAGNSTTSSSISVTVSNSGGSCFSVPDDFNWVNQSFTSQSSNFTVEFDATVYENQICDITVSQGNCTHENDAAAMIRFKSGEIKARNGQAWENVGFP
ncbi:MAG: Ig-like domain-containing protein, partial [Marinoscillum sp.]